MAKQLYTCAELAEKYKNVGYSKEDYGNLVRLRLVKFFKKYGVVQIDEDSVIQLFSYRNNLLTIKIDN